MAKFISSKYSSLRVSVDGTQSVRFVNGEVEATGKAAERLRRLDESYGVTEDRPARKAAAKKVADRKSAADETSDED